MAYGMEAAGREEAEIGYSGGCGGNVSRDRSARAKERIRELSSLLLWDGAVDANIVGRMAAGYYEAVDEQEEEEMRRPRQGQFRYVFFLFHDRIIMFTSFYSRDMSHVASGFQAPSHSTGQLLPFETVLTQPWHLLHNNLTHNCHRGVK